MKKRTPICPKCGYDQSGEIATWESLCPVEGRCPECGFAFAWADVMDPARVDLGWYVEHAKSKREVIRRTGGSLRRLILPHRYWREVGVHTRIRPSALIWWSVFLFLCLHIAAIVPVAMGNWEEGGKWWGITSIRDYIDAYGYRGFVYEMHNAVAAPFFQISYDGGSFRYLFGRYFHQDLPGMMMSVLAPCALTTSWFMILILIPTTRKSAMLRKKHVVRAWLVSLVTCVIFGEYFRVTSGLIGWSNGGALAFWLPICFFVSLGFMIVWIQWFWIAAIKVGWEIRPYWLISLLGVIASLLSGFTAIMYGVVY